MMVNFDFNLSETYSATTITGATLDKYVDQSDFITGKIIIQSEKVSCQS